MNQLRAEADNAITRAEEAEAKNKKYEQALLEKDQEITSLQHKLSVMDGELEKAEHNLATQKTASAEGEQSKQTSDLLTRKVQLLEEELRQVDVRAEHFERQVQRAEQERDAWEKKYEESEAKYKQSQAALDDLEKSMQDL
ncbi:hypothetical protein H0H92_006303 [Tricholoma furcatifolium]|nr:hypothetical protein H0H92_006303 [Tricholoma furcatifolium]